MLATHRKYIQLLREEIEKAEQESNTTEALFSRLRLMDSFLRESARMNPIDGCKFISAHVTIARTHKFQKALR
jgi:hypothetical protein